MPQWLAYVLQQATDISNVINTSISAGWLVLVVVLLRLLLKNAPKWTHVALWGIVALRLLMPFSIESVFSLIPSTETISQSLLQAGPVPGAQPAYLQLVTNPSLGSPVTVTLDRNIGSFQLKLLAMTMVWLIGMAVMALYTIVSYLRLRRSVSTAVRFRDNLFQSEQVTSPFVLGIVKPRIYLPFRLQEHELSHVIAHEQAHIRRKDHWWKPLGFLLLTIHWFNPLMWLAYALLCRDIELACDERVIRDLDHGQRADYSQALVSCSVGRSIFAACPLAFGEVDVKKRVAAVMHYKKPAFWIMVSAVVICIAAAVCFLTDPIGFRFDEDRHTILSAHHFDMRTADDAAAVSMNTAQLSELGSRLAGVKHSRRSDHYAGLTPGYQIGVRLQDGTYLRISGYSLSETDMVDIEWNGKRYVVSDPDFQAYVSRICSGGDTASAPAPAEPPVRYYLTIGDDHVHSIEVTTPHTSGGCQNADDSPYRKRDRVWLEPLDGCTDLRGVIITARDANGYDLFSVRISDYEDPSHPEAPIVCGHWVLTPEY